MSNITPFDPKRNALPAHIQALFNSQESNIAPKQTVPSLSYEGKRWSVILNGDNRTLTRETADGDTEPLGTLRAVVLDYAKKRGRTYYEGTYDPGKPGKPVCWSEDGVTPDAGVLEPQGRTCDGCPKSVKGSRVSDNGKPVAACSQHLLIVVVPLDMPDPQPVRCKLAITSVYDKQSPQLEQDGWYAFDQYVDFLRRLGAPHTATLVTKMKFDPNATQPKVIFSPSAWLTEAQLGHMLPLAQSEDVKALLTRKFAAPSTAGVPGPTHPQEQVRPSIPPEEPPWMTQQSVPASTPNPKNTAPNDNALPAEVADILGEWADEA